MNNDASKLIFNWQQPGWPKFTFDRAALRDVLDAFTKAFRTVTEAVKTPQDPVSKPTATRDLAELADIGAIVVEGAGPRTHYFLNFEFGRPREPINEPIIDGIKSRVLAVLERYPGKGVPFLVATLHSSSATIERAIAALVAAGKIEHRGSRKTGGYFAVQEH